MNGMAWRCDFPGERVQLRSVRRLVEALLVDCPVRDDAIACVVELSNNAILHTRSAGGVFTVGLWLFSATARVAVRDAGGSGEPVLRACGPGEMLESGRGLAIVAALCTRMGVVGGEGGRVVWADLGCEGAHPAMWSVHDGFSGCCWGLGGGLGARSVREAACG
jgi:hypothetical protein